MNGIIVSTMRATTRLILGVTCGLLAITGVMARGADSTSGLIRSAKSGPWSSAQTWEGGKVPGAMARVQVRTGHTVQYDIKTDDVIRFLHIAGVLSFAPDKDTQLNVGLISVQAGEDANEYGIACEAHIPDNDPTKPRPTLEVGTPEKPISSNHTALIRLVYVDGMDKDLCPAIVCCGARMDFHGAPLSRTWLKLGDTANVGDTQITLSETVTGWRPGDKIFLTATTRQIKVKKTFRPSVRDNTATEERVVKAIEGNKLTLDQPLVFEHLGTGEYRGEVANLSRNVMVESADPGGVRGHTMYHRNSAGSISYAEFRHLGKQGVLGRYSLHFHLIRDTMRGSSVIGASIWDSGNRWITIHGTDYLVVRDCVGYHSVGHGYFLEDGTEEFNVLDRNLAVQACKGEPLPKQVLPYDHNDGAGFWWANSLNTFTRNVAAECDEYGFRYDAVKTPDFDPVLNVPQPDGTRRKLDIRTLPFVRFADNEVHCMRRHSVNLGGIAADLKGSVAGVGPDAQHPFVLHNTKIWNIHWAFHTAAPNIMLDGMDMHFGEYGLWRVPYEGHAYRNVTMSDMLKAEFMPVGTKPQEATYPKPLSPVDDLPPATVITHVQLRPSNSGTSLLIRGTTSDNGAVKRVVVNEEEAKSVTNNFAEWEIVLKDLVHDGVIELTAFAEDDAGNIEPRPHVVLVFGSDHRLILENHFKTRATP